MSKKAMTIDEIVDLGKEGFFDLMLARLRRQAEDPSLSEEERSQLRERVRKVEATLAERRQSTEATKP